MKHEKSKNDAMRHELDHIDAKILNLLRENARICLLYTSDAADE